MEAIAVSRRALPPGGVLAELAKEGVDIALYGQIHSYYAFANAGIPAYISGGGGSVP
jgi:hypothetical protein